MLKQIIAPVILILVLLFILMFILQRNAPKLSGSARGRRRVKEKKPAGEPAVWTTEEFEYTFSEKVRDKLFEIKDGYIIGFWVLLIIMFVAMCIYEKRSLEDSCLLIGVVLAMCLLTWSTIGQARPAFAWVKKGTCAMDCDGIYLVSAKGKRKFVSWESIVAADRRKMNVDGSGIDVICCFRDLDCRRRLDMTMASMTLRQGKDVHCSMFYQVRDEVVTIGYTKSRMKKIREYLKERGEEERYALRGE